MQSLLPRTSRYRTAIGYVAMLAVTGGLYWFVHARGEHLSAPAAPPMKEIAADAGHTSTLAHVLLALAVITLTARVVGGLGKQLFRQPPVMGEILAGLMLGPSLLGAVWPDGQAMLFPADAAPYLGIIAKVGVVLFMFLVGLELDPKLLRGNAHATIVISQAGIIAPFVLGSALALAMYPVYSNSGVSFTVFSLFLGVSLSVTAFPILARILTDRRAQRTSLGVTALACAAVGDVTAWTMLAFVTGVASAQITGVLWTLLSVAVYVLVMVFAVRPLLLRAVAIEERSEAPLSRSAFAAVFFALLLSAFATESMGIHALFGAFFLGALMPHEGRLAEQVRSRLEDVVIVLFLPVFFAFTGMRTEIGLVSGAADWLVCGAIIFVATLGKFGGSFVAARFSGLPGRESAALGVLMNTRGLMELIVLNLGLDLGVISPTVFTMLVIMALVTTFSCSPALDLLLGKRGFADAGHVPDVSAVGKRPT